MYSLCLLDITSPVSCSPWLQLLECAPGISANDVRAATGTATDLL
jgi:hypothetical protein